ncbi:MAG TPA: DUF883 C-terminal domain-containing protein [Spongiibacteraceae bacterium]|jgi:ElaB/YqjD/DUF883 family membrane-anchored ribosome-binding protein
MSTETQKSNGNGADSNVHAGTEAAARVAHDFVDRVAKIAGQSEEHLRKVSADAEASVKQSLDTARNKSEVVKTTVGDFVQQHPLAAIGIAFGVGVLLSYVTRGTRTVRVERDDDIA